MLFNSFSFFIFFTILMGVYYLPFIKKLQIILLVISSIYFYSTASLKGTVVLLFSIVLSTTISYFINLSSRKRAIFLLTFGIITNLGLLAFFKYSKLFTLTFLPEKYIDEQFFQFLIYIPLPIGISFFTFESISLLVDTLNKQHTREILPRNYFNHLRNTSLFISFFPHLIAGPILKADHFIPQISIKYFKDINWEKAFKYLILGYFFKIVIADNLKEQTLNLIFPFDIYHPVSLLIMLFGYSIQIFTDFAGYSLIALGLASLLGYDLVKNFNYPYISSSFSEFWTRWHISLSKWLKEYLYIPLGGNRKGALRTYFNLFIVMVLGGLWHGATWGFALWGIVHGMALAIEKILGHYFKSPSHFFYKFFKTVFVFTVVTFAWLFFKLESWNDITSYFEALALKNWTHFQVVDIEYYILIYSIPVIVYYICYLLANSSNRFKLYKKKYDYLLYALMLFLIVSNAGFGGSFIYFRF